MEQSVKAGITTAVAAGLALVSAPASAAGWYGGLSIGETSIELEVEDLDFEADDSAFKVFGGFMFNEFFGVEIAYLDLGDLGDRAGFDGGEFGDLSIEVDAETTAFSGEFVAQYPLGPVDLFAKAGIIAVELEADATVFDSDGDVIDSMTEDDRGDELIYTIGARYNAGQFGIRAEYQMIDADAVDELTVMSIGVEYRFAI